MASISLHSFGEALKVAPSQEPMVDWLILRSIPLALRRLVSSLAREDCPPARATASFKASYSGVSGGMEQLLSKNRCTVAN